MKFSAYILLQLCISEVSTIQCTARNMPLKKAYVEKKKLNMYNKKHRAT